MMFIAASFEPVPRFPMGRLAATCGVEELVRQGQLDIAPFLLRHLGGDWGDLCAEDKKMNDLALTTQGRLLSFYQVTPTLTLYIITEWDRSVTTLLLPSEY